MFIGFHAIFSNPGLVTILRRRVAVEPLNPRFQVNDYWKELLI
jgi:hypothetical protein